MIIPWYLHDISTIYLHGLRSSLYSTITTHSPYSVITQSQYSILSPQWSVLNPHLRATPNPHALPSSHLSSVLRVIPFPCHGNTQSHSAHSRQRHRPPVCLTHHKPPPHRHPHPVQYTSAVAPHGSAPQYHISTAQQPHTTATHTSPPRSTSHLSNPLPLHPHLSHSPLPRHHRAAPCKADPPPASSPSSHPAAATTDSAHSPDT